MASSAHHVKRKRPTAEEDSFITVKQQHETGDSKITLNQQHHQTGNSKITMKLENQTGDSIITIKHQYQTGGDSIITVKHENQTGDSIITVKKQRHPTGEDSFITVKVQFQLGPGEHFRVKRDEPLRRLMMRWADWVGWEDYQRFYFIFKHRRIPDDNETTADDIGLEDGDSIIAVLYLVGD